MTGFVMFALILGALSFVAVMCLLAWAFGWRWALALLAINALAALVVVAAINGLAWLFAI